MYEKELQRILTASQNNALTFFVGAGVSALSGAPTWKGLIHAISDRLGQARKDEYSSDEYLQIPQMFYYFHAYARLLALNPEIAKIAIATPCGNLGNLTAALFSHQMGLPVNRIIAAGHNNERLWGTISSGRLEVSNFNSKAMSTNVARINSLFRTTPAMAEMIECHTYNDEAVADQIRKVYAESGYLMDRNTAMASRAIDHSLQPGETGVFLATASPEKYAVQLIGLLGDGIKLKAPEPESRHHKIDEPTLPPLFPAVRRYLLENKI